LRGLDGRAILAVVKAILQAVPCRRGPHDLPFAERHRGWSIALVRRGTFTYRAADARRAHVLREGWLLLCRKGQEYECAHPCAGGDDCAALNVPEHLLEDVCRHVASPGTGLLPTCALPTVPRAAILLERAMRALDAGQPFDADTLAVDVIESVLRTYGAARAPARQPSPAERERVQAAVALLDARSEEPWPLSELAGAVGSSTFQLVRAFRALIGMTPHRYLVARRVRRAAMLLLDTRQPVTDVAFDVGFGDLSNFIRTFRRELGSSPRQFRRDPPRSASRR
jgi:AraC-like DNA-binding protein